MLFCFSIEARLNRFYSTAVNYLYLLTQLARRDIASRYQGSAAGLLWAFFSPVLMLLVYTFVFGYVFKARWLGAETDRSFFALNLFAGMLVHGFFAECAIRSPGLLQQHSNFVKRIIFPLWLLPLVPLASALFHTCISFLVLFLAHLVIVQVVHWQLLLLPFLLVPFVLFLLGLVWIISALGVYLKDLSQIIPILVTVLMFMSPVFYPAEALPEQIRPIMYMNPLTPAIETLRAVLFHGELPSALSYGVSFFVSVLFAMLGFVIFNRLKVGFSDVL